MCLQNKLKTNSKQKLTERKMLNDSTPDSTERGVKKEQVTKFLSLIVQFHLQFVACFLTELFYSLTLVVQSFTCWGEYLSSLVLQRSIIQFFELGNYTPFFQWKMT